MDYSEHLGMKVAPALELSGGQLAESRRPTTGLPEGAAAPDSNGTPGNSSAVGGAFDAVPTYGVKAPAHLGPPETASEAVAVPAKPAAHFAPRKSLLARSKRWLLPAVVVILVASTSAGWAEARSQPATTSSSATTSQPQHPDQALRATNQTLITANRKLSGDLGGARRNITGLSAQNTNLLRQIAGMRSSTLALQAQLSNDQIRMADYISLTAQISSQDPVAHHFTAVAAEASAKFQICLTDTNSTWAEAASDIAKKTVYTDPDLSHAADTVIAVCQTATAANALLESALAPAHT
jgi:hypothetical protein